MGHHRRRDDRNLDWASEEVYKLTEHPGINDPRTMKQSKRLRRTMWVRGDRHCSIVDVRSVSALSSELTEDAVGRTPGSLWGRREQE